MMEKARLLYVSSCWLHDKEYGGQLRALNIARALQEVVTLTLVIVGAEGVSPEHYARTVEEFDFAREIKAGPSPVRSLRARWRSISDPGFTNIHGIAVADADEQWLKDTLQEFDLIWFSTLRTANLFKTARWPRSVIDIGDLPSSLEASAAKNGPTDRPSLRSAWRKLVLRQHEKHVMERFDVGAVCSEADRRHFRDAGRIHIIPNGFSKPARIPVCKPTAPARIGFIGLLDYFPNMDGVNWFVANCLSEIAGRCPGVTLRLIGSGTDQPLKPAHPAVKGLGWVDSPEEEIATWSVMIVPIRVGAGTRVKIADAFSRKCPVVSTSLGAYGYDVHQWEELRLADTATDFATACVELIENPVAASEMSERAYGKFLQNWTWEAIAPRIWETANDCLRLGEVSSCRFLDT